MGVLRMRSFHGFAHRNVLLAGALTLAVLVLSATGWTKEPAVWAITNVRVVPVSSAAIEKGTIVIRNGIIESVGSTVAIPGDARVLDGSGLTVYPGLIDALSDIGLEPERQQPQQRPGPQAPMPGMPQQQAQPAAPPTDEARGLTPYRQTADLLVAEQRKIASARNAGITTTLVAPRGGFISGQSSIINLSETAAGRMVVKTPVAFHVSLNTSPGFGRGYPSSRMGVIAHVKQTLLDAQRYEILWKAYTSTPGVPRPEYDRVLESLQPLVKGQMPAIITGDSPTEIERALQIAESFHLVPILAGCMEAGALAPALKQKNVPLLVSVKFPERQRDGDPEAREELEALRRRVNAPANAAALAKAGVRFAFISDDLDNPRDFVRNVGRAVEAGLDRETALRAMTLTAAEILGIADRTGSIEKNKAANLILATGDLFSSNTRVRYAFIDGMKYDIPEPEERDRPGGSAAPASPTPVSLAGVWNLVVSSPQGPMDVTLTLRQNGNSFSGTVSSALGTSDIYEATLTGSRLSFKVSISSPSVGDLEVLFTGSIQGAQITGTASVGDMGAFDFTGSRAPAED